ncbi:MAG TPA: beta-galactosidase trimerization domain-containing protein, partial [Candidatus Hydrogenedentes bacterium]|nr:beta-galactosidase trimerization domain-containing protein [Candidatus Hydrogenedentota bacterium]
VAILRNYAMLWSIERQPGALGFHYDEHCYEIYRAVKRSGHGCDFVDITSDLAKYAVVFAPCACLADKALADRLDAFAQAGGTVVLTPQSGARTPANTMWAYPRPGAFVAMAGLTVEEVRPYHHGQTETLEPAGGQSPVPAATVEKWVEVLACREAQPIAQFADGALKGKCAAARNARGKGAVYYLGVYLPAGALEAFAAVVLPPFPITAIPPGVEITRRTGKQGSFLFVINHADQPQTLALPKAYPELLTGETLGPEVTLEANQVRVFTV